MRGTSSLNRAIKKGPNAAFGLCKLLGAQCIAQCWALDYRSSHLWTPEADALLGSASDAEIAARLGISPGSVYKRRKESHVLAFSRPRKPPKERTPKPDSKRRPWTAEEDQLLGTKPDRILARRFDRSVVAVTARRRLKHIRFIKVWRPEDDQILGTRPDRQVAMLLGRSLSNVAGRRRKLGIPCRFDHRPWAPHELDMLGNLPDEEIARVTGHPLGAVAVKRQQLGRTKPNKVVNYWSPEEDTGKIRKLRSPSRPLIQRETWWGWLGLAKR